jgi:small conductance mechanosensitive channel
MITGETEPARQWAVAGELRRRIKKVFEQESIEIPFSQLVVHSKKN